MLQCSVIIKNMVRNTPIQYLPHKKFYYIKREGVYLMSNTKICAKCLEEKNVKEFSYHATTKDHLYPWCKQCYNEYQKIYKAKNKEVLGEKRKAHREENIDEIREKERVYYEKNKDQLNEKGRERYKNNREKELEIAAKYRLKKKQQKIKGQMEQYGVNTTEEFEKIKQQEKEEHQQKMLGVRRIRNRRNVQKWQYSKSTFKVWENKLTPKENPTEGINGELLVECFICGKKFNPTNEKIKQRADGIKNGNETIGLLFCSDLCTNEYKNQLHMTTLKQNELRCEMRKIQQIKDRIENFDLAITGDLQWFSRNKQEIKEIDEDWYLKNNNAIVEEHIRRANASREKDKLNHPERSKEYYAKNKEEQINKSKNWRDAKAKYAGWFSKLTIEEDPKEDENGYLLVKCAYCGRYFTPMNKEVQLRARAIVGVLDSTAENRLYCSDGCKEACPIYKVNLWPRGYKKATSREVNPLIRQMCLEMDGYICQLCYKTIDEVELHAHHEKGVRLNPIFQNDVDNTITLCKECHKKVHSKHGCRYIDLRCN